MGDTKTSAERLEAWNDLVERIEAGCPRPSPELRLVAGDELNAENATRERARPKLTVIQGGAR